MKETYCKPVEEIIDSDVPLGSSVIEAKEEIVFSNYEEKLYRYPASDSEVLIHIASGVYMQRIDILENGWSKVVFDGTEGYMLSTDLEVYNPAYMIETNDEMYIAVEVASVHDIKSPHETVDEIEYATKVTRIGVMSNQVWSVIKWNDDVVYILSNNLVSEKPVVFTDVEETLYLTGDAPLYTSYEHTSFAALNISWSDNTVHRTSIGDNGWSKILYEGNEYFIESKYLSPELYPIAYQDETCAITIYREWYGNAWVYAAHLEFTDYSRLTTDGAYGKNNVGRERTSTAFERVGAIFMVNGDYAVPGNMANSYAIARNGVVFSDGIIKAAGVYNNKTGLLMNPIEIGIRDKRLSTVVNDGTITDTFQFAKAFLINGEILEKESSNSRAQRTFIGTNGNAGDIWIVVSDGRYNDGESAGLTGYQCAAFLKDKGCVFGLPLDGGGSSTMVFKGVILNAVQTERAVADFLYLK